MRFSASAAQRVEACPPSAVLPHIEHEGEEADKGSAAHEHMELRVKLGVDGAVEALDETFARWNVSDRDAAFLRTRLMKFDWSPPVGSLTELRLALMPDFTVKEVPRAERWYPGALFTGASDYIWAQPKPLFVNGSGAVECPPDSMLYVADLKSGLDSWVPTIETNLQAALNAWMAAKLFKARRVVPAIIFPSVGMGEWDTPKQPWGPREIDEVEARIRRMLAGVERAKVALETGAQHELELKEGRHCEYCPAINGCPAKVALLRRAMANDTRLVPEYVGELERDDAVQLARLLGQIEGFGKRARAALVEYVRVHGPIDIGDGLMFGPAPRKRTRINPKIARTVLSEEIGEAAESAFEISGASMKRALEEVTPYGAVAGRVRRLYGRLGALGGLSDEGGVEFRVHRPKSEESSAPLVDVASLREQLEESVKVANEIAAPERETVRFRGRRR